MSHDLYLCAGVSSSPPVRSDARADEQHRDGLLEDGVGASLFLHHDALPSGGKRKGKK